MDVPGARGDGHGILGTRVRWNQPAGTHIRGTPRSDYWRIRVTDALVLNPADVTAIAPEVFRRVWRAALGQPGFALLRFTREVSSRELREAMVELVAAFPVAFVPERFGRFDQQVSSKFHRDGAPLASLLVLGYEPTDVRSRFWIADASAA